MPFLRRQLNGGKETDRTITGQLPPPEPGRAQTEDGRIVGSLPGDPSAIKTATEVHVTLPGPREQVIDAKGNMSPRWYRFFQELYRRTGATRDNVNLTPTLRKLAPTTGSLAITGGTAPTVGQNHVMTPTLGSLSLSSEAPTIT